MWYEVVVEVHFFPHVYGNHIFHMAVSVPLKVLPFPAELHFHFSEKSVDFTCVAIFLCSLFCFIDLYSYLHIYVNTVLITVVS